DARVNFIKENPQLLISPRWMDRGTKMLSYLANVIVNGNPDVKFVDADKKFPTPCIPPFDDTIEYPKGTKDLLEQIGREKFVKWVKNRRKILFTDTTFRDAHQSLLATRVRTKDLVDVAESFARNHAQSVFSMEVWGGATFDVCMRFLKEDPWARLAEIRKAVPNILLQMLLRGSNAVGYKAYPDNLVENFIIRAADTGIDVFRIFDSLNWVEGMKFSIKVVREKTNALAEACICYTGDITDPSRTKYNLKYYLDLAKKLEAAGAHMLCIKDMAGLLKPYAAQILITELRKTVKIPIHLHTHDTSSIQAATCAKAIEAKVDVLDVALSSMAGLTSQPSFNSIVAMMKGQPRENIIDLQSLQKYTEYWEAVRQFYYPFETELKGGTADVYDHEIPGGQYSNLRPQARGLGLEDQFETIKKNYRIVNDLLGDIVKVTPSSKVVGDMAMFMTANKLTKEDVLEKGDTLAFPDSMKSLMRGDLGQTVGGFPKKFQKMVLKGEKPFKNRPNSHLAPINFKKEIPQFQEQFGKYVNDNDFLSYQLYPKVFEEFHDHYMKYGTVQHIPTPAFFYGLKPNEEILIEIEAGKNILVRYLNKSEPDEAGMRKVAFLLNGQNRTLLIKDKSVKTEIVIFPKAKTANEIGAPLQGSLSKILVKEGQKVEINTPLFIIEAMKMESTITSPIKGVVKKIHIPEKSMVEQDDMVVELSE
ncbi:MAG TPA: pyruvate carboxylase subunit B, partial [Phaeodactylibacter sp.]|nr:pyruvate carboxylase subunit B [Phaeodactylibacter sp.]